MPLRLHHISIAMLMLALWAGAQTASADAVDTFVRYCYEPNRLGGAPNAPDPADAWAPVPGELRARLGLPEDPAVRAWTRTGGQPGEVEVLKLHVRELDRAGVHSGQLGISCELVVNRPELSAEKVLNAMRAHLDSREGGTHPDTFDRLGYPTPEGWNQACWTILTRIENRDWRPDRHDGQPACFHLTTPENYATSQYIVIRALTHPDRPVAVLAMDRTLRPDALQAPNQ